MSPPHERVVRTPEITPVLHFATQCPATVSQVVRPETRPLTAHCAVVVHAGLWVLVQEPSREMQIPSARAGVLTRALPETNIETTSTD